MCNVTSIVPRHCLTEHTSTPKHLDEKTHFIPSWSPRNTTKQHFCFAVELREMIDVCSGMLKCEEERWWGWWRLFTIWNRLQQRASPARRCCRWCCPGSLPCCQKTEVWDPVLSWTPQSPPGRPLWDTQEAAKRETEIQTDAQSRRRQAAAKSHIYQFISLAKTKQIASRQTNRRMRPGPWQTPTHLSNRCWLWAEVITEGTFFANWNSDATRFMCVLCILLQHAPTDRNQQAPCGVTVSKHFCLSSCVIDLNSALWSYIFPLMMLPNFPFIDKKTALIGLCCSLCSHIGKLVTSPPSIFSLFLVILSILSIIVPKSDSCCFWIMQPRDNIYLCFAWTPYKQIMPGDQWIRIS